MYTVYRSTHVEPGKIYKLFIIDLLNMEVDKTAVNNPQRSNSSLKIYQLWNTTVTYSSV